MEGSSLSQLSGSVVSRSSTGDDSCLSAHDSERNESLAYTEGDSFSFGRSMKVIFEPISESVNKVNPKKVNILETIASFKRDDSQRKSNSERIIAIISSVPEEKKEALLVAFKRFLVANRITDKALIAGIISDINDYYLSDSSRSGSSRSVTCKDVISRFQEEEIAARQLALERSELEETIVRCVATRPVWFEDRTYVERQGGDYTLHVGQPGTDKAMGMSLHIPDGALPSLSCRKNPAGSLHAGVQHGNSESLKAKISCLAQQLQKREFNPNECKKLLDYANSRIQFALGGFEKCLLSLYLVPVDDGIKMFCLGAGEFRMDMPSDAELQHDVKAIVDNYSVFAALIYCICHNIRYCASEEVCLENFLKYEMIRVTGKKEVFLDVYRVLITERSPENSSDAAPEPENPSDAAMEH